uniref:Uncharacterized protein n=1 Tax=Vespula pensylvanica TaxID=30213 RepID=A0A834NZI2_VESPE|nr:hypothetical protein H0235_009569 [Vespula pensylvanica]
MVTLGASSEPGVMRFYEIQSGLRDGLRAQLASIFDSNTLKQYPGPGAESRFNVLPGILSRVRKRLTTSRRREFRHRATALRMKRAGDASGSGGGSE